MSEQRRARCVFPEEEGRVALPVRKRPFSSTPGPVQKTVCNVHFICFQYEIIFVCLFGRCYSANGDTCAYTKEEQSDPQPAEEQTLQWAIGSEEVDRFTVKIAALKLG